MKQIYNTKVKHNAKIEAKYLLHVFPVEKSLLMKQFTE